MAKTATTKSGAGTRKTTKSTKGSSSSGAARSSGARSSTSESSERINDPVDAVIKLLQSPLVIDLLAVGATAALATITEQRSSRSGATQQSGKVVKAAGKAAAAAIGRRLTAEIEEIRTASGRAGRSASGGGRGTTSGEAA